MAGTNWGMAAGGAQDAMQQMLEQRILEEKMALAQRQQQAEEAYRAAQLQEQQAGRMQQGSQFGQTHGLNVREFEAGTPQREANVAATQAQTGGQVLENVGKGMDVTEKARLFKARPAAEARIAERPGGQAVMDASMAGITTKGVDPNDLDGAVNRTFVSDQNKADRGATIAAAGIRSSSVGGQRPMTQGQRASLAAGLRKDYNANVKEARTIGKQVELMNRAWESYDQNPNAASQGLLVTFQKILDPTSVVRESEYARTFDGQAVLDQMAGAFERLKQGGSGVPRAQLEGFKRLAEQFAQGYAGKAQEYQGIIDANADEFGIDKSLIYREGEFGGAAPAGEVPTAGAAPARKGRYNPATKRIEY